MLPQNNPDRIRILFDDHRLVANAGTDAPSTVRSKPPTVTEKASAAGFDASSRASS